MLVATPCKHSRNAGKRLQGWVSVSVRIAMESMAEKVSWPPGASLPVENGPDDEI